MGALLKFAAGVDWINERLGRIATWLVLLSCLVSAGNASIRYLIDNSSNAWLELQWYMFAYIVMLGASYTLKVNEHVRVDLVYGQLSGRGRAWVDLLGTIFFLLPAPPCSPISHGRNFMIRSFITSCLPTPVA